VERKKDDPSSAREVQLQLDRYRKLGGDADPAVVTSQLGLQR
jgi:hypothetical protein